MTRETHPKNKSGAFLKALVFAAFIAAAVYVVRFTPVKAFLTAEARGWFLDSAGMWAIIAYMAVYAVGLFIFSFFIPKIIKKVRGQDATGKGSPS